MKKTILTSAVAILFATSANAQITSATFVNGFEGVESALKAVQMQQGVRQVKGSLSAGKYEYKVWFKDASSCKTAATTIKDAMAKHGHAEVEAECDAKVPNIEVEEHMH